MVNMLLQEGALTDEFRARFGLDMTEADHGALHPDVARSCRRASTIRASSRGSPATSTG